MTSTIEVLKADVMALAVKSSEAEQQIQFLGMMNQPTKIEDRVKADAQYMIAKGVAENARKAYNSALDAWIARGQPE